MSTQNISRRLGRLARTFALTAVSVALTATLFPTEAMASSESVTITSPADGEVLSLYGDWENPTVAEDPLVVTFIAEGAPATCSLDGQAAVPCTSPATFEHVVAGPHEVTVTAGSASRTNSFTVNVNAVLLGPPPEMPIGDGPYFRPIVAKARWKVRPRRTWVRMLELRHLPGHVRVHVACKGRGCPSPHRFTRPANNHLDLTRHFRGHGLRPGTRIVIRIAKCGEPIWTFRYRIRSGARPTLTIR